MMQFVIRPINAIAYKNKGFTMIEMMLSLSIILMILSLIPLIFTHINQLSGKSTDHFDINNALFQRDLYEELQAADYVSVDEAKLNIYSGENTIEYGFHKNRIVRKLNQSGYIIMLEGVEDAKFIETDQAVYLQIYRKNKQTMEYRII